MRRVYTTYVIGIASHPLVTHAVVLGTATVIFAKLVHVAAVYRNITQIQVGELGGYFVRTIGHMDTATLLTIGLMAATLLSLRMRLPKMGRTQIAQ